MSMTPEERETLRQLGQSVTDLTKDFFELKQLLTGNTEAVLLGKAIDNSNESISLADLDSFAKVLTYYKKAGIKSITL